MRKMIKLSLKTSQKDMSNGINMNAFRIIFCKCHERNKNVLKEINIWSLNSVSSITEVCGFNAILHFKFSVINQFRFLMFVYPHSNFKIQSLQCCYSVSGKNIAWWRPPCRQTPLQWILFWYSKYPPRILDLKKLHTLSNKIKILRNNCWFKMKLIWNYIII